MNRTILKFGGTSLGSAERIQAVAARIIDIKKNTKDIVVIVSAMGKSTDFLVDLAKELSPIPDPREFDALLSTGENISSSLLAMTLIGMGHPSISLSGIQAGVHTETLHMKAKILRVDSTRIEESLSEGKIVIISGFQGFNEYNDVTTIGRGGSDTSAVVFAAALNCAECNIFTDVDGIYTTDPRKVETAKKLTSISYDEMLELASLGAGVLHPRAVECAKENNIVIHVRSSFSYDEGTRVMEVNNMEAKKSVTGITINEHQAIISVLKVPDTPGFAGFLFTRLGEKGVNIDMIIQNVEDEGNNNISFTVQSDDLDTAAKVATQAAKEMGAGSIKMDANISKVSAVGIGMISRPGVAAKMFKTLGDANINILRIATSEIKISCAIAKPDSIKALKVLHDAFELEK
jgi:aspartate kinase